MMPCTEMVAGEKVRSGVLSHIFLRMESTGLIDELDVGVAGKKENSKMAPR